MPVKNPIILRGYFLNLKELKKGLEKNITQFSKLTEIISIIKLLVNLANSNRIRIELRTH
jgi:hypothetical protein